MSQAYPPLDREQDVLRAALEQLRSRLPAAWQLDVATETKGGRGRADAVVTLSAGPSLATTLLVEAKRTATTRDLRNTVAQLRTYTADSSAGLLLVARYLPAQAQDWLTAEGVNYADATGNLRIQLAEPPLFLRDVGAAKDPWRGPGRPRGTLQGEPAARVVRALADFAPPYSVPDIMKRSGSSSGPTYRVIDFLEEQSLIEREPAGKVVEVSWRAMLNRWSADYAFQQNAVLTCLQPRGLPQLLEDLAEVRDVTYAVTGSLAAKNWAEYAPAKAAMIYAEDPQELVDRLGLRVMETGVNVLIAAPKYDAVYDRAELLDDVRYVAPSQAVADLLSGPGRNPSEAEALLDWMEAHEQRWRA